MNRRDGNIHIAVLYHNGDDCVLAEVRWDKDHKCKNGLIGAWELSGTKSGCNDWTYRKDKVHLLGREDLEWEDYS